VRTRDVWTLNPGLSFGRAGGKNSGGIELEERNLLGLGTELQLSYKSSVDRDTIKLDYHDPNLGSSWWDLNLRFADNSDGQAREFALQQPFYAFDTRRSMGGSIGNSRRIEPRYDLGEIVDEFQVDNRTTRLFYGWSAGLDNGWVTRLTAGLSYEHDRFNVVNGSHPTRTLPEERKLVYPWIGWERREEHFRKDRNRDQIRRTEDLSLGWRMNASLGFATPSLGADRNAWIYTASIDKGFELTRRQLLLLNAELEGRLEDGSTRNLRLQNSLRYYFRQSFHRLTYLSLESSLDINPDSDRQLLLGGDNGLRGYPLRYQAGEGFWLITAEQRLYTNWYPFRLFNIGAAIFADIGATWGDNPHGSKSLGLLRDVGFGLRLGNSRSALGQIIHVDFAFPLDGDDDISRFQLLVTTQQSF
jgi:outer membrane protein assembly factor BamA